MPVYEYNALDKKGKTVSGIMDAESATAARKKLRAQETFPVSIKEALDSKASRKYSFFSLPYALVRVRASEIALTTRQLATLVGAGFPLVSALETLIPQTKSNALKKTLVKVKDAIVGGNSFSGALTPYAGIFSPLYVNMIRAGESSGTLEIVLDRLADLTEKQEALKEKIRSALAYPVFMAMVGVAVLFFLMSFIVPNITGIFTEMKQNLPAPTLLLIGISNFLKSYGWLAIPLIILAMAGIRSLKKTRQGRRIIDKTALRTPGIGPMMRKLSIARFSRTLASLLENGVSMLTALEIVKNIAGNTLITDAIEASAIAVGKGQGLGASMAESKVFPMLSIQMIQVGEQSGELETMLNKIADVFEKEVESTVLRMTSLLEPVMILVMGVAVGLIVLSICLPIFEMQRFIG